MKMKATIRTKLSALNDYALCVALLPFVIMLYQYQKNIKYLSLWHVLAFTLIVSVLLLAIYYISRIFIKSNLGTFLFVGVLFISFFIYIPLSDIFKTTLNNIYIPENKWPLLASVVKLLCVMIISVVLTHNIQKIKRLKRFNKTVNNGFTVKITSADDNEVFLLKTKLPVATLLILIFWYFVFRLIYSKFFDLLLLKQYEYFFLSCAILFAIILAYICWKFNDKLKSKKITIVALTMICVMIIQNVGWSVAFAVNQKNNDMFYKETFNVDSSIERPNIYWIHADGMLGFDSMSRFFGDNQEDFASELEKRGFWINREAAFNSNRSTEYAMPMLMNPYYYDHVMSWEFAPEYAESIPQNKYLLENPSMRVEPNFTSNRVAREKNELVLAFNAAGYDTNTISGIGIYFYPNVKHFYNVSSLFITDKTVPETMKFVNNISKLHDFSELLFKMLPLDYSFRVLSLNIVTKAYVDGFSQVDVEKKIDLFSELNLDEYSRQHLEYWNSNADSLYDSFKNPSPRVTFFNFLMPHHPYHYDEHGIYSAEDTSNPMRYPAHHTFTANTALKYLDLILENDPDAVIILQADHGLTSIPTIEAAEIFSCTYEESLALFYQPISALRLPKECMTQETEIILSDPLNISRYLINNFVGENYDYIPIQYKQVFTGPEKSLIKSGKVAS